MRLLGSIDSIVARLALCTPNSLRSDQCNFCRLLTSQTCRTIAETVAVAHHLSHGEHGASDRTSSARRLRGRLESFAGDPPGCEL